MELNEILELAILGVIKMQEEGIKEETELDLKILALYELLTHEASKEALKG